MGRSFRLCALTRGGGRVAGWAWQSERLRISELGGIISEIGGVFRVNGSLAVTRAFGDSKYGAKRVETWGAKKTWG